jgi:hypothetical protein
MHLITDHLAQTLHTNQDHEIYNFGKELIPAHSKYGFNFNLVQNHVGLHTYQ